LYKSIQDIAGVHVPNRLTYREKKKTRLRWYPVTSTNIRSSTIFFNSGKEWHKDGLRWPTGYKLKPVDRNISR
ncbi:MAG: hypothetical protein Q8K17_02430, partial [Pseudohongiella sp.]|nr:hypothetical protein [Pseudohongiella sp.]